MTNKAERNLERISYAVEMFELNKIEYALKNEKTGHFHCRKQSDDSLVQFWAGTGKIGGREDIRGIHSLIRFLTE